MLYKKQECNLTLRGTVTFCNALWVPLVISSGLTLSIWIKSICVSVFVCLFVFFHLIQLNGQIFKIWICLYCQNSNKNKHSISNIHFNEWCIKLCVSNSNNFSQTRIRKEINKGKKKQLHTHNIITEPLKLTDPRARCKTY